LFFILSQTSATRNLTKNLIICIRALIKIKRTLIRYYHNDKSNTTEEESFKQITFGVLYPIKYVYLFYMMSFDARCSRVNKVEK